MEEGGSMTGFRGNNSSEIFMMNSSRKIMLPPPPPPPRPPPHHLPSLSSAAATTTTNTFPNNHINTSSGTSDQRISGMVHNSAAASYFMDNNNNNNNNTTTCSSDITSLSMRAKIMSHPHFTRLLTAYANCQKVGAPPEVVERLEEVCASRAAMVGKTAGTGCVGEDPALDQFMEAYCEMLIKYEQELTKPFKEAMLYLSRIESQFKALTLSSSSYSGGDGRNGSSEEELDATNDINIDPQAEDRELKGQLLRRYSGYLGSLKQEFMKKKKKGKLPKEARQQLLDWWSRHYKWPYPSESEKLALAETTGLDQKQINNWFINQRKRHWKPSEDMQFVVMDAAYPHYYLENVIGNPFSVDCPTAHI